MPLSFVLQTSNSNPFNTMEITKTLSQKAIDYKKNIAGKFMLVEGAKVKTRVAGTDFCVTRKIDGHLQVLFYQDGEAVLLNSNGIDKAGRLHCLDVATECLKKAGVREAVIAAELYMPREGGRPRCADVLSALADEGNRNQLCLAPFDMVSLDGKSYEGVPYQETYNVLSGIFKEFQGTLIGQDLRLDSRYACLCFFDFYGFLRLLLFYRTGNSAMLRRTAKLNARNFDLIW